MADLKQVALKTLGLDVAQYTSSVRLRSGVNKGALYDFVLAIFRLYIIKTLSALDMRRCSYVVV